MSALPLLVHPHETVCCVWCVVCCVVLCVPSVVSPAQVEQHNSHVQSSFAQRMDTAFGDLQRRLQQQEGSQRHLLAGYTRAVGQNQAF